MVTDGSVLAGYVLASEAARLTGYSADHLRRLADQGTIPVVRVGLYRLYPVTALTELRARRERRQLARAGC